MTKGPVWLRMADEVKTWTPSEDVTDVDIAFPARGIELTPIYEHVPERYKQYGDEWVRLADAFFFGNADGLSMIPHTGVDPEKAWRHLQVVAGCFGTKHEHKIAGLAFLLAEWFDEVTYVNASGNTITISSAEHDAPES